MADIIRSTERMVTYYRSSPAEEFIILIKIGMCHRLECKCPGKKFRFLEYAVCGVMKMATLEPWWGAGNHGERGRLS